MLELTYRCNHRCLFCSCPWEAPGSEFQRAPEMTTAEWREVISRLCAMGVMDLAFTGGEAILRQDLPSIVAHAASCPSLGLVTVDGALRPRVAPPSLHLISNARAMTDGIIAMCREHGVQLSMSLPGLETFERHTGYDGADGVLHWLGAANEAGLEVVANITVTRLNLHELEHTIAAALLSGAHAILLNRFMPGGRGLAHLDELLLTPDQVVEALDVAEQTLETAGRYGSLGTEVPRCVVDPSRYTRLKVSTGCSAAVRFFVVGPGGHIRVCNHSPVNVGHVSAIDQVASHPYWRRFALGDHLPDECGSCRHLGCAGGCREAAHVVHGSPCAQDVLIRVP